MREIVPMKDTLCILINSPIRIRETPILEEIILGFAQINIASTSGDIKDQTDECINISS